MSDNQMFAELKQEIARAVELIKEKHGGANIDEARQLLGNAKEAIAKDEAAVAAPAPELDPIEAKVISKPEPKKLSRKAQRRADAAAHAAPAPASA